MNPTQTDKPNTPSRMQLAKVMEKKLTVCHAGAMTTQPKPIPVKSVTGEVITQQLEVHVGVLMLWPCSRLQPATTNLTIPASSTYRVTPDDHTSTLNPGKVSRPLAISGGWNAGDPWLVRQVSSTANVSRAWWKHQNMWSYYYISQYKKFRAWWKHQNMWSYYYIYHSTTRNYIRIMKNSNTQLLLHKVHWDSCIFPEHYYFVWTEM